ncbi:hypothetical protein LDENG_00105700 [Lucifuga dentata]|nr:hypothetical protein LDENG_00105700 [Lucifuga dentata]
MEYKQIHSEESKCVPLNESTNEDEAYSSVVAQNISSADEDGSEADEQHSAEEERLEIIFEMTQQNSRKGDVSNCGSHSEEEKDKQPSTNNYVELNVSSHESISRLDIEKPYTSEEEQLEVGLQKVSHTDALSTHLSNTEKEQERQTLEEDQTDIECKEQKTIIEKSLSGSEEDQESMKEEQKHKDDEQHHEEEIKKCTELKDWREEKEEDKYSSEEDNHDENKLIFAQKNIERERLSNLIEHQDSYTTGNSSLIKQPDSLGNHDSFDVDKDSGNDHNSFEEHEVEQPKGKKEQISCLAEDELSNKDKESSSEDEHRYIERYTEYQDTPAMAKLRGITKYENDEGKHKQSEVMSPSVAERVSLLEKQVADAQQRKSSTGSCGIKHSHPVSDVEDSTSSPTSQSALCTRSAPQSSLSFSYDSNGVITSEPEGNRVKSIREMFLAKSATDIQKGQRTHQKANTPGLSELRAETSVSGGYQSQTSTELSSSGEDDSSRKIITKGFVRRTIERLYGKKDPNADENASQRPPSGPKQKKEHSGFFSPFHSSRSKAVSEFSYFNSTNTLDTLSEATRIAFNASVGPDDSVPIDKERWLLRENTQIRKSVSEPVGINKILTDTLQNEGMCEDTENVPYSLFSTKSESEEKKLASAKCTYFSLHHASDSDLCHDDVNTITKSNANGDSVVETKDNSKETKMRAEKNGTQSSVGIIDFKMLDNKVHPLTEGPADNDVVEVQPGKGYGVVNRRVQDPDVLDFLYDFCGQHCPIL